MQFFHVDTLDDASAIVRANFDLAALGYEELPLELAVGRYSYADIVSSENLPDYNRSTVDGYAVYAPNTYGASDSIPTLLNYKGKVSMGEVNDNELGLADTLYVPTGGAVPRGANAMVMIEHTERMSENIAIYRPATVGENIIAIGDDVQAGEVILHKGERITPLKAGLLAALGISKVKIYNRIKVAIISTGDELVAVGDKTRVGEIRDTNTILTESLLGASIFQVTSSKLLADDYELLYNEVHVASNEADLVLISGGSSIGAKDYTEKVLESLGTILVHGIAIKPGKPTIVANIQGKLAIGLPGHPMACALVLKLLVIDNICSLFEPNRTPFVYANTSINFPSSAGRLTIQPVKLEYLPTNIVATPIFYKSGLVSSLATADGYVLIPHEKEGLAKNASVKVYLL